MTEIGADRAGGEREVKRRGKMKGSYKDRKNIFQ